MKKEGWYQCCKISQWQLWGSLKYLQWAFPKSKVILQRNRKKKRYTLRTKYIFAQLSFHISFIDSANTNGNITVTLPALGLIGAHEICQISSTSKHIVSYNIDSNMVPQLSSGVRQNITSFSAKLTLLQE